MLTFCPRIDYLTQMCVHTHSCTLTRTHICSHIHPSIFVCTRTQMDVRVFVFYSLCAFCPEHSADQIYWLFNSPSQQAALAKLHTMHTLIQHSKVCVSNRNIVSPYFIFFHELMAFFILHPMIVLHVKFLIYAQAHKVSWVLKYSKENYMPKIGWL